jgi:predicted dehydrogenase/nucleoside-diphosphate-sugar epimerase
MSTPPVRPRYLILGGGAVVAEFYLPALSALGWLQEVWVADPSKPSLDRLSAICPDLNVVQVDFRAALDGAQELGIQAVIVALPNALHEQAVALAVERGLDVLCEKPLALTEAACTRLATLAEKNNRILAVGMTRRFLPSTRAIQQVIDAGWVGDVTSVELEDGHNFAWSSESGAYGRPDNAGVVANIGVHALDLVEHLFGTLTPVAYTDDWRGGVEVNATFTLATTSGTPVRLLFSYTRSLENGIRVRGTRGEVWQDPQTGDVQYRNTCGALTASVTASQPYRFGDWPRTVEGAIREEFSDFNDAITRRRAACATARDAARTAALIDWAYSQHTTADIEHLQATYQPSPRLAPGRIVITGGTGFVGGHLLEALTDQGHRDLVVPIRSYHRSANAWRYPVQLRRADLLDPSSLRELMAGARHVFHLAFGRDGANAARVTVEGTKNVVEAAIDAGAESVIVVSTTALFGDPGGPTPVDETFPYDHQGRDYPKTKIEAERWTLARARRESKTRIVVVNPSCVYGPEGRTYVEMPARLLKEGTFCWIEDGRGIVNYVYVGNLVEAMLLAAVQPDAHGERFIVSDGSTTWREFYTKLFGEDVSNLPSYTRADLESFARARTPSLRDVARTVVQSGDLWRMVGANPGLATTKSILERVTPGLYKRVKDTRHRPPQTPAAPTGALAHPPILLDDLFGATTTHVSSAKARRSLGWNPRVDLAAGQKASREWLATLKLI